MPWEKIDLKTWATELNVDLHELRQKDQLIDQIIQARKEAGLTQAQLAKQAGVSQPRIAQIETRSNISTIKFDALFKILSALGYEFNIATHKV